MIKCSVSSMLQLQLFFQNFTTDPQQQSGQVITGEGQQQQSGQVITGERQQQQSGRSTVEQAQSQPIPIASAPEIGMYFLCIFIYF